MSAFVIGNLEITDPERYAQYARHAPATVAAYGGEYLARGGESELLEGDLSVRRVVILRFPSIDAARAWYRSAEYAPWRELRNAVATGTLILTAGLDED